MAARSSGMPSTAVYLVWPSLMALIAACLILSGVSKSGSPAPRPITSRPAAFSSRALLVTAMVGDGWMRPSDSARNPLGSAMAKPQKKAAPAIAIAPQRGKSQRRFPGRRPAHIPVRSRPYRHESGILMRIAVLICLALGLAACSKPSPPVGKWEGGYEGGGDLVAARVEILPSGQVKIMAPDITNAIGSRDQIDQFRAQL